MLRTQFVPLLSRCALPLCGALLCASLVTAADDGMQQGTPDLKHAGPLAFGPNGILLVGDSRSAAVYAIDTGDHTGAANEAEVNIEGINKKIAAMIGSAAEDTVINDMVVNPSSGSIYLSVARGRGPSATPIIFKADSKGNVSEVNMKDVRFSKAELASAPESGRDRKGRNPRLSSITDIQFDGGKVIVAGLSNEEFASKLRVFDFPFTGQSESSTSIEVYHGAHGRLETASPVRTFITYEDTVLAAYTCTPLVTIPVEDLDGKKVMGKTVAELGNRNHPLDMIIYKKGDQDYLLIANNARGVMKLKISAEEFDSVEAIRSRVGGGGTAGIPYETLPQFEDVVQLDRLGEDHAVMLIDHSTGDVDLKTVALP